MSPDRITLSSTALAGKVRFGSGIPEITARLTPQAIADPTPELNQTLAEHIYRGYGESDYLGRRLLIKSRRCFNHARSLRTSIHSEQVPPLIDPY